MIGQTVGHYRIESKLGEGGMGVVYKARDTHLDRPVAIKVLPPEKVADRARKQRFIKEARAASALSHPNIVTIYDIRSERGVDFIDMEYVAGKAPDCLIGNYTVRLTIAHRDVRVWLGLPTLRPLLTNSRKTPKSSPTSPAWVPSLRSC